MDSTSTNDTKLTLPRLAAVMAEKSGLKKKTCEDFLRELFSIAAEELSAQQPVKIKGFGNFKLLPVEARKSVNVTTGEAFEIPAHHKVVFTPSKELAALANEAFEIFEITELDDSVTPEDLDKAASEDTAAYPALEEYNLEKNDAEESGKDDAEKPYEGKPDEEKHNQNQTPTPSGSPMEERLARLAKISQEVRKVREAEKAKQPETSGAEERPATVQETLQEQQLPAPKPEDVKEAVTVAVAAEPKPELEPAENTSEESMENEIRKRHRIMTKGFILGFVSAAVLAAVATGCLYFCSNFFSGDRIAKPAAPATADTSSIVAAEDTIAQPAAITSNKESDAGITGEETADNETAQTAPTQASDSKVVYDTVTETHFLTKIAKKHYGNYNLWPYIYEENKAILGHPDRIKPGTRVVVPDLSKYDVDPKNKADIEKAKKKAFEIYSRYK